MPADPHDRPKAAKEPETGHETSVNPQEDDRNPGITNVQPSIDEEGHARHHDPDQPQHMTKEHVLRQQEELRSERDHGYGSEYIGNEYKDVKIEDHEKDDAA
jgi:hypothetical protein